MSKRFAIHNMNLEFKTKQTILDMQPLGLCPMKFRIDKSQSLIRRLNREDTNKP